MKFILTVIAVSLIAIAIELYDKSYYNALKTINDYDDVSGYNFSVRQTINDNNARTKYVLEDKDGSIHPIFISKEGSAYIIKECNDKEYKYYLPIEIKQILNQKSNKSN